MHQLLEDISMSVRNCALVKEERKNEAKNKDEDHRKGVEMRQPAMMSRWFQHLQISFTIELHRFPALLLYVNNNIVFLLLMHSDNVNCLDVLQVHFFGILLISMVLF